MPAGPSSPLSTPTTVDLVEATGGTLASITTGLRLLPGTYSQIRLIPLDASGVRLATSASDLGAIYNAEADFVDSTGTTQQVPLELLNPDKGIAHRRLTAMCRWARSARPPRSAAALGTSSTTNTTATTAATTSTTDRHDHRHAQPRTTSTTTTTSFTLSLDGTRDLVPFTFGTTASPACANGILLSSHAGAFNLDNVGGISGTLH